jgi:hypothetical protein
MGCAEMRRLVSRLPGVLNRRGHRGLFGVGGSSVARRACVVGCAAARLSPACHDHPAMSPVNQPGLLPGGQHRRQRSRHGRAADHDLPGPSSRTSRRGHHRHQLGTSSAWAGPRHAHWEGDFTPPDGAGSCPDASRSSSTACSTPDRRSVMTIVRHGAMQPGARDARAFATFWASVADMSWLAGELGQEHRMSPRPTRSSLASSLPNDRRSTSPSPSGPSRNRSRRLASRSDPRRCHAAARPEARTRRPSDQPLRWRTN